MRRAALLAAIVVAVGVAIVAAVFVLGDDETESVSTSDWADSVCSSLSDWRTSIASLADVSGQTLTPELLQDKIAEGAEATSQLVTELQGLDPPDLEAGEEVKSALDDQVEGLRASFAELEATAEDVDSGPGFVQDLAALAPRFQGLLDQVRDIVATLQSASLFGESSAELEQAFAGSESCQSLQEQG